MQMTEQQLEENFYHQCIMYSGIGIDKQRDILERAHKNKLAALDNPETARKLFGVTVSRRTSRRK